MSSFRRLDNGSLLDKGPNDFLDEVRIAISLTHEIVENEKLCVRKILEVGIPRADDGNALEEHLHRARIALVRRV